MKHDRLTHTLRHTLSLTHKHTQTPLPLKSEHFFFMLVFVNVFGLFLQRHDRWFLWLLFSYVLGVNGISDRDVICLKMA